MLQFAANSFKEIRESGICSSLHLLLSAKVCNANVCRETVQGPFWCNYALSYMQEIPNPPLGLTFNLLHNP